MNKKSKWMTGVLSTSLSLGAAFMVTKPVDLCHGFLPENNYNIPVSVMDTGISKEDFDSIMNKFESIYKPVIALKGGKLILNRKWDDGTVNASAQRFWTMWIINMYGGLARYPGMTKDGMTLVVCHETGHQLGGAPKVGGDATMWATNEGGADYFSTLKCARKMFGDEDNQAIVLGLNVPETVKTNCDATWPEGKDSALCQRTAVAGIVLGRVLGALGKAKEPSAETPDTSVVSQTNDDHPAAQCRLDTYFQGAICDISEKIEPSGSDYHVGSCTALDHQLGVRPACWFKADVKDSQAFGSL